jgi:NAD+ diphosphatase
MMNPINRLSWLRLSHNFLNALIASPKTQWMVFKNGKPLATSQHVLVYLSTANVRPLLGSEPFFGQGQYEGQSVDDWDPEQSDKESKDLALEAIRLRGTPIVFLGLLEHTASTTALVISDLDSDPQLAIEAVAKLDGTPYFTLDVGDMDPVEVDAALNDSQFVKDGGTLCWTDAILVLRHLSLTPGGAAFAQARSMLDWNLRNKVCP